MMPLDAMPNPRGNIIIRQGIAHYAKPDEDPSIDRDQLMISHFATCPNALKHRKAKTS